MTILEALAEKNIISPADIPLIEKEAESTGKPIDAILVHLGVPETEILKAKGKLYDIPTKKVVEDVPFEVLEYIPEESAIHYRFVPLSLKNGILEVGIVDPDNIEARDALSFISSKVGVPYKVYLISAEDFAKVLNTYKGLSGEVTKALTDLETEFKQDEGPQDKEKSEEQPEEKVEKIDDEPLKIKEDTKIVEDAPVTKIVATILRYATEGNASDIHIEAMRDTIRVRFRVDGVLSTSLILPTKIHSALISRIKILCNMRLDEKRKPQDGRFSAKVDGRKIDFRVSTFPTYFGEKIVMRILDPDRGIQKLDEMGMTEKNLNMVKNALKKPYGLILISGPTGSGKTTTLYSMLNLVDREKKNVLSLEDPIEYNIEGINQSQVRPEIGYTFANGLRTTLRQDPNVIMVGEIRDKETAQLAVQAALTGHLVLSTIHTNNAVGVIPRLIDMGVDPYLIAPTLVLAMAQRLSAKLIPGTGKDIPIEDSVKVMLDKQFEDLPPKFRQEIVYPKSVKESQPTPESPSGTRGRVAVFEMFEIDKDIERIVLANGSELEILKAVREKGTLSMREDAILKAFQGLIPFSEINKL